MRANKNDLPLVCLQVCEWKERPRESFLFQLKLTFIRLVSSGFRFVTFYT